MKLTNLTRGRSQIGRAVKIVHGGFKYAKVGDSVIGITVDSVPPNEVGEISSTGIVPVLMGKPIQSGQEVRFLVSGDTSYGCLPIGGESSYTSIGRAVESGKGLVRVAINIRSV